MPWRFVEMYGRTQFSDIVVFQALEENTRALRLLGRGADGLPFECVRSLAIAVRRLAAAWELLRSAVPADVIAGAQARLQEIDGMLAPALLADAAPHTVHRIAQRADNARARAALERLEPSVKRLLEARVPAQPLLQLSVAFQAESSAWQLLPLPGTRESDVLDGFEHTYRAGQEIALRQAARAGVEPFAEWRRLAECAFHQLDSIRPTLCAGNRARRWCLGRLIDAFCRHDTLLALRRWLPEVELDADELLRVEAGLEASLDESRARAVKLVPHAYAAAPADYRASIAADVSRFALTYHQPLPRSA